MQLLLICWRMDAAISQRLKCKSKRLMANATQPTKRTVSAATDTLNIALYQVEIHPADGYPDRSAERVLSGMREAGIGESATAKTAHGFLVQGRLSIEQVSELASQVLSDSVVQQVTVGLCGGDRFTGLNSTTVNTLYVLPKAGVTDPEAETALRAVQQLGFPVDAVRTFRKYVFTGLSADEFQFAKAKYLTNQSIEQAVDGGLQLRELQVGQPYKFELIEVPLRKLAGQDLDQLSKARTLSLTRVEMEQIQSHFVAQGREPTDIELDTIAQTWSEHCSHKTLAGRIQYRDENGEQNFDNMLKETIFAATTTIRNKLGANDWCVSVFKDNAGIIRFDDQFNVTFKVETHNRPSAIEPYGGANTGLGGVIRDTLGTGMGAKPVCSTDVFCFAPPDT